MMSERQAFSQGHLPRWWRSDEWSGCLGMGSNPAAVRVFRNRPPKDLRFGMGSNPAAVRVFRNRPPKDVLLGMGLNPAAVRVFRNRPPRDLRQWFRNQPRTEGARQKNCFLWVPKVTGSILSGWGLLGMGSNPAAVRAEMMSERQAFSQGHLLRWCRSDEWSGCLGMGSNPAAVRVFRNRPPKDGLLGMGSNPAGVRVFRNRPPRDLRQWFRNQPRTEGARQKNCFLWVPKVTGSILSGCVLLGMGSNPAAVRVFRNRPPRDLRQWFRNQPCTEGARQKNCFLWVPKVTGSILSGCVLLGMGSNPAAVRVFRNRPPRGLRQWFRNQPRTEGARQKNCFLWVPKVTGSILSGCVLLGMGSNPAAVRVFRNRPPRDLRQWFPNQPRTEGARQKSCFLWVPKVMGSILSVSEPASKGLAPMVSEPASHRGCQTKELFLMGSKGDGKHFVGLRFAWHGLESCCCSSVSEPASKGVAPMVSEPASHRGCQTKELFFCGFQRWREAFCRAAFCLAWARILLLFGCFGTGLQRTCSKATGVFPCKAICRHDVGATSDLTLAWARILLLSRTGLQGTCANGFGTRLAPRVPDNGFMGSKGDGKHFVGLRFAWHGLKSCCCSSVSEPASKGLAPMVSEPASHRGCQTKELLFMGSKGDGKHFVGLRFAWHGLSVSEPASKGLAPMVSEPGSHRGCQTKELFFMGSKGDGKHFVGLRFAWHGLESCCCSSVSEPASKGLAPMVLEPASHQGCQTKELFFMGSKGDGKHFLGLRFAWHGLESCCCSSVSEPASKGLAPMVSEPASHRGCQTKELFLMGSKGDGKHFVGLRFAWHGLEPCCCSSVSEPASKGVAPMVSEPASHRGCQTKELFFCGFQRWREAFCRAAFCLAWARILLLFGCFGTGLQRTCANGFGTSLAPRVPDKRTVFYGFQRWREAFCRAAFCLAWARILLLFECFGTGLQGTCANGFGTSLAPRVDKRTVFYGFQRWREAFCRAAFCLAWARILLLFECFGTGLQWTCANGFGTSLAPRLVPDKRTVFYGFQRWREAFCRAAFCLAWARILLLLRHNLCTFPFWLATFPFWIFHFFLFQKLIRSEGAMVSILQKQSKTHWSHGPIRKWPGCIRIIWPGLLPLLHAHTLFKRKQQEQTSTNNKAANTGQAQMRLHPI